MRRASTSEMLEGYAIYFVIWLALLVLTSVSWLFAKLGLGAFGIMMVVLITPLKAWLVLDYFMHLREESALLKNLFSAVLITLMIFIGGTLTDVFTR